MEKESEQSSVHLKQSSFEDMIETLKSKGWVRFEDFSSCITYMADNKWWFAAILGVG